MMVSNEYWLSKYYSLFNLGLTVRPLLFLLIGLQYAPLVTYVTLSYKCIKCNMAELQQSVSVCFLSSPPPNSNPITSPPDHWPPEEFFQHVFHRMKIDAHCQKINEIKYQFLILALQAFQICPRITFPALFLRKAPDTTSTLMKLIVLLFLRRALHHSLLA